MKSDSTPRLPVKCLLTLCTISSAKTKESLTGGSNRKSIGLNGRQTSVIALCTLQMPYKILQLLLLYN